MLAFIVEGIACAHPLIPLIIATGMLGICAGVLGCFTLLRGQSLFGDAMAHASLPGIAVTFMLTRATSPFILLAGGTCASLIGALVLHGIQATTKLKIDTTLGCILSFFFGTGLVLMTIMQRSCGAQQAVLGKFLFGNAALLLHTDMYAIVIVGACILACIMIFWKEFLVFTFDPFFAKSMGYSIRLLDIFLIVLLTILIAIGLQTVGVILITALLIAPAAAARQWTMHLHSMALLAAIFGALSTMLGSVISYHYETIPTGPAIVVVATVLACVSLLRPSRG